MASSNKRQRALIASLVNQGCTIKELRGSAGGFMVLFPNGESMTVHGSEGDHRAEKNTRARVLRAGLSWPFDPKKR